MARKTLQSLERLDEEALEEFLERFSAPVRELALAVREIVLAAAPLAAEGIRFGALSYFRPDEPFGAIGGNICMIEAREAGGGGVRLSFIHGESLPDPGGLLRGEGKAKRYVDIESIAAARGAGVRGLIKAAAAHRAAK